jgi:hypothetical protein
MILTERQAASSFSVLSFLQTERKKEIINFFFQ